MLIPESLLLWRAPPYWILAVLHSASAGARQCHSSTGRPEYFPFRRPILHALSYPFRSNPGSFESYFRRRKVFEIMGFYNGFTRIENVRPHLLATLQAHSETSPASLTARLNISITTASLLREYSCIPTPFSFCRQRTLSLGLRI